MKTNTLTFIGCDAPYKTADIILFGAPFDGTTSYRPGTRFAPQAIRIDSDGIETYSPYLDKAIDDIIVSDIGDVDITYGNTINTLNTIQTNVETIINDSKKPFMIGGEHLVTLPAIKALHKKYQDLIVIQFDAHADLRDTYLKEPLSHATVIRRIYDLLGDNRIYQFGVRSGLKSEFDFAKKHTTLERFQVNTIDTILPSLKDVPVYITLDLDVLDPSVMMGTGTPEPGGLTFHELMTAIHKLKNLNIVGCDVVELSPHYDQSGVSTAVASKIIRELLLLL